MMLGPLNFRTEKNGFTHTHTHTHTHIYIYICVCMYVCMYISCIRKKETNKYNKYK